MINVVINRIIKVDAKYCGKGSENSFILTYWLQFVKKWGHLMDHNRSDCIILKEILILSAILRVEFLAVGL